MFPWLAFGHMIPNLERAKLLKRGSPREFRIHPKKYTTSPQTTLIKFVQLPLPKVDNLTEHAEATSEVPYDVVPFLKTAYDALEEPLTHFLESSKPDWVFYDFVPFWTKFEGYTVAPLWLRFPTGVAFRSFEVTRIANYSLGDSESRESDSCRMGAAIPNYDLVAIRGCTEFEP